MFCNFNECMLDEMMKGVDDVWDLCYEDCWKFYKFWIWDFFFKFLNCRNGFVKLFEDYSKVVENEWFK